MFELIFAYVDPGVGATVLQLILAGTVGIGALIKLRWQSIKKVFRSDDEAAAILEEAPSPPSEG